MHDCMKLCEMCGIKVCHMIIGQPCASQKMWLVHITKPNHLCKECCDARSLLENISS